MAWRHIHYNKPADGQAIVVAVPRQGHPAAYWQRRLLLYKRKQHTVGWTEPGHGHNEWDYHMKSEWEWWSDRREEHWPESSSFEGKS